jgi:hypothetical protein
MAHNVDIGSMSSTVASESDARRGERRGRAYARLGIDIPPLVGGAYAVGFLYGYKAQQRLRRIDMPAP